MALIRTFEARVIERRTVHDEIPAAYSAFTIDGRRLVQIDTFGREVRQHPGKKSQTIQLDRDGAHTLVEILKQEFGFT